MSGALVSFAIRVLGVEGSIERAEVDGEIRRGATNPQLERALQERSAGRLDEAFNLLSGILRREPEQLDASLAFWDVANDLGRPGAAASAILRVVRDEIQRGDCANAVKHWLELAECGFDGDAEPALLIRMATMLRDAGERQAAVRALRNALLRAEGASATAVASRVAREASELDPGPPRMPPGALSARSSSISRSARAWRTCWPRSSRAWGRRTTCSPGGRPSSVRRPSRLPT